MLWERAQLTTQLIGFPLPHGAAPDRQIEYGIRARVGILPIQDQVFHWPRTVLWVILEQYRIILLTRQAKHQMKDSRSGRLALEIKPSPSKERSTNLYEYEISCSNPSADEPGWYTFQN